MVVRGVNDDELVDFVALTRHRALQVRFIELMPFTANAWERAQFLSSADQLDTIRGAFPAVTRVESPPPLAHEVGGGSSSSETARVWRVPGHAGSFGFISSMSDAFCGTCDRLRLTADGAIKACLHGAEEHSLRDVMRAGGSDAALVSVIRAAVQGKHFALGGSGGMAQLVAAAAAAPDGVGRPMVRIGG